MNKANDTHGERRRFLMHGVRGGLAGLLTLGVWRVSSRPRQDGHAQHTCTNRGICGTCDRAGGCILPQALSFRLRRKQTLGNASQ